MAGKRDAARSQQGDASHDRTNVILNGAHDAQIVIFEGLVERMGYCPLFKY
ncbi:hypothetical protein ACM25N_00600 [Roseovarius sp. C7]|uniref:hypothetical protein n=1 Tax=Roseovarius sp. C7 TaxID=3398643 RepID=UPI0039F45BAB